MRSPEVRAYRTGFDAACGFESTDSTSAVLEIDVIDGAHVAGAIEVVLKGGERLLYTFDAPFCIQSTPAPFSCSPSE